MEMLRLFLLLYLSNFPIREGFFCKMFSWFLASLCEFCVSVSEDFWENHKLSEAKPSFCDFGNRAETDTKMKHGKWRLLVLLVTKVLVKWFWIASFFAMTEKENLLDYYKYIFKIEYNSETWNGVFALVSTEEGVIMQNQRTSFRRLGIVLCVPMFLLILMVPTFVGLYLIDPAITDRLDSLFVTTWDMGFLPACLVAICGISLLLRGGEKA